MSNFINALNGKKSYLGFTLLVLVSMLSSGGILPDLQIADLIPATLIGPLNTAGTWLGGIGVIHKWAKQTGG